MRYPALIALAALAAAATAAADEAPAGGTTQDIYVYTGEHGEMAFSDVAHPGAERVAMPAAAQPTEDAQQVLERRIERTLRVADALERSRLAREKARAEARAGRDAAREQSPPVVVYQDRYVGSALLGGGYRHWSARSHHHRFDRHDHRFHRRGPGDGDAGRDRREGRREERTLHEKFLYDPD